MSPAQVFLDDAANYPLIAGADTGGCHEAVLVNVYLPPAETDRMQMRQLQVSGRSRRYPIPLGAGA
jgi:hypothetical protein